MPSIRSMKIRLPVSSRWTSSRTSRVCLRAWRTFSAKPAGRSALTPPTRPYEIVRSEDPVAGQQPVDLVQDLARLLEGVAHLLREAGRQVGLDAADAAVRDRQI